MDIDGGCFCGAIRYRARVDPAKASVCHCVDCQELTGSAYRITIPAEEADFEMVAGEPAIFIKTAESGRKREHAFCGACGSPIYATTVGGSPKIYGIRIGTVRQRGQLPPKRQIWCRSALPWLPDFEGIPEADREWKG